MNLFVLLLVAGASMVHCTASYQIWSSWSPCNVTCGAGGMRFRQLISVEGDVGSVMDEEFVDCYLPCPQDCLQTNLTVLSVCNRQCGGGEMTLFRAVVQPSLSFNSTTAADAVKQCTDSVITLPCNPEPCAYDCQPSSQWSEWTACNDSKNGGKQWRNRTLVTFELTVAGQNASCPAAEESRDCVSNGSVVVDDDCLYSDWDPWTACAGPCYKQLRFRYRFVAKLPGVGGTPCVASLMEQSEVCPSNCFQEKLNAFCAQRGRIGQIYAISQCNAKYFICLPSKAALLNECPNNWFFDPVVANCRPIHQIRGCSGQLQGHLFHHSNINRIQQQFGQTSPHSFGPQQYLQSSPHAFGLQQFDQSSLHAFGPQQLGQSSPQAFGLQQLGQSSPHAFGLQQLGQSSPHAFGSQQLGQSSPHTFGSQQFGQPSPNAVGLQQFGQSSPYAIGLQRQLGQPSHYPFAFQQFV